jgi:hypothetical protein
MDKSVALVLKGFIELDEKQRSTFIEEVNKYIDKTINENVFRESIRKSVYGTTVNFGPAPTGCPCCGK